MASVSKPDVVETEQSDDGEYFTVREMLDSQFNGDLEQADIEKEFFPACRGRSKIAIRTLLQSSVDGMVNMTDDNGLSGLSWACLTNNLDAVTALIEFDSVDLNQPDKDGNTPLMLAAQGGHDEIVRFFVVQMRREVDIDLPNHNGFTALMKAALNGKTNCARLLIIAGADVTKTDWRKGFRADEWAMRCGMRETATAIRNVAKCKLTENQTRELKWEKKQHPIIEFCFDTVKRIRRIMKWEGDEWMAEAGSLYHLVSHSTSLPGRMIATDFSKRTSYSNRQQKKPESITSNIEEDGQGDGTLTVEITYESVSHVTHSITQRCYKEQDQQQTRSCSARIKFTPPPRREPPKTIPDLEFTYSTPVEKQKRNKANRSLLCVPPRVKKKKCPD